MKERDDVYLLFVREKGHLPWKFYKVFKTEEGADEEENYLVRMQGYSRSNIKIKGVEFADV